MTVNAPTRVGSLTIQELWAEWSAANTHKATTYQGDMRRLLTAVDDLPGVDRVDDLTTATVAALVGAMMARGVSRETIRQTLVRLGTLCNFALARGYLERDPVQAQRHWMPHTYQGKAIGPPAADLASDDVARMLCATLEASTTWKGQRLHVLAVAVVYAGLRLSEAVGLRWEDVDMIAGKLTIHRAPVLRRVRNMPPRLATELAAWQSVCGSPWVFPGCRLQGAWTGGPPPERALGQLRAAGQAVGLAGIEWEQLRDYHTACGSRVTLPNFETRPAPARPFTGPPDYGSGPKRSCPSIVDLSGGPDAPPIVRGVPMAQPLPRLLFEVLDVLIKLGCGNGRRVSSLQIKRGAEQSHPVQSLHRLRKVPGFDFIRLPGKKGLGGYGFDIEKAVQPRAERRLNKLNNESQPKVAETP